MLSETDLLESGVMETGPASGSAATLDHSLVLCEGPREVAE